MTADVLLQKQKPMDADDDEPMIGKFKESFLLQRARDIVSDRTKDWEIFDEASEARIPKFDIDEIILGKEFGRGGFFVVSEVTKIALKQKNLSNDSDEDENEELLEHQTILGKELHEEEKANSVVQDRKFMAKNYLRNGKDGRYAFKIMQDNCREDPTKFVNTVVDIVLESKFLSVVRHPNIIKMRGMAYGDPFQPQYFILLDRLYGTLKQRIDEWHVTASKGWFFDFGNKRQNRFFAERLMVAYDVASAMEYLHDLNIIYRDLKPSNVGFDVRGDVKLYDFGLAIEHDAEKAKVDGTYRLTGDTGTVRYMAPEVSQSQQYSDTADVYSFGILLWEICHMTAAYKGMPDHMIELQVVQCGVRPKIDAKWPNGIRKLLHDCFASNPRRPSMKVICNTLRTEINKLSDKKLVDEEVFDSARSAFSARWS